MGFLSLVLGVLTGATAVVLLLVGLVRAVLGRARPRWWVRALVYAVASVPVHALVTVPVALGYLGSRMVGTRGDERDYAGPRIAADGTWLLQSRDSLRREAGADRAPPAAGDAVEELRLVSADGTPLRAFRVAARVAPPRATVILVHGLFRGALELEPVGAMFRDLGCEVVLLELRNHGGSGRAPATFGLREADDVLAAVDAVRSRPGQTVGAPLVLFGVSLGTAAVGLAAPRVSDLGGLVLDAPLTDARATANRMLSEEPRGRRVQIPWPIRGLALAALELWSGFDLDAVRPGTALTRVPATVPVLVVGAGDDRRMPPDEVRALFVSLPQPDHRKMLWILDGADHGDVWRADADGYRARLDAFLALVTAR